MKGMFCAVLLLACACLTFQADAALCQAPVSGDDVHVRVTGRPWETDESKYIVPGQQLPGGGGSTFAPRISSPGRTPLLQQRNPGVPALGPMATRSGGHEHPFDFSFLLLIHQFCR